MVRAGLVPIVAMVLLLVGCSTNSGGKTTTPSEVDSPTALAATPTASTSRPELTGISVEDKAIDGELRASINTLQPLLRYASLPCMSAMADSAALPSCPPGERNGTLGE